MKYPPSIRNLIERLSTLPSVGPKTAERYVFYLLKQNSETLQELAQAIAELKEKTIVCKICGAVSEKSPCYICSDSKRDKTTICVISNTRDMLSLESTGEYSGLYHILGGVIDTIKGTTPEELNIKALISKIKSYQAREVILALNPNIEGETTTLYLVKLLKNFKINVTRLAKGLPTGADLEYADESTLTNALKFRNKI